MDLVGCAWLADKSLGPELFRYQTLTALQLSSQTKDPITAAAIQRLKELPGGLTPLSIDSVDEAELAKILYGVSFHIRKASYLKRTARIIIES